jgi:hypothetical protein
MSHSKEQDAMYGSSPLNLHDTSKSVIYLSFRISN